MLTKLLMLCFMCRDLSHATAEVWCYFFSLLVVKKMQTWKQFSPPHANKMEAIWFALAEGISTVTFLKALYSIINE